MLTLLAVLLLTVVPGVTIGSALVRPESTRDQPGLLLASWFACGAAAALLTSGVLERTVGITSVSSWLACVALTAGGLALLTLRRTRVVLREGGAAAATALGAIAAVAAAVWMPMAWLVVRTTWAPLGSTPWYYAGLAEQVADEGRVPASSVEWGVTTPFLDDYHLFTTATAVLFEASGAHMAVLRAMTLLAALALAVGAATLSEALGAGRLAALAAVPIALATGVGAPRLSAYRPEAAALGLTLLIVTLVIAWLRSGDRGVLTLTALVVAGLSQVHGIALLTAGLLLAAAGTALAATQPFRRHVARCAVAAAGVGSAVLLAAALFGQASGSQHVGDLADIEGLEDPTWEFYRAISGAPPSEPPTSGELVSSSAVRIFEGAGAWLLPALVLACVSLVIAVRSRHDAGDEIRQQRDRAREALVFAVVALAGLACAAAFFGWGWSSYVPRRTGAQRLVLESSLLIGPLVACGLSAFVRWSPRRVLPHRSGPAVALVAVAAVCVASLLNVLDLERAQSRQRPAPDDLTAMQDLGLAADDVVLVNAYTEGVVRQVTGATALLEGRAPYTFPDLLTRSNSLLRQAQRFFENPSQHGAFLVRNDVDYVILTRRRTFALASDNVFRTPSRPAHLRRCSGLEPEVEGPRIWVFRVVSHRC